MPPSRSRQWIDPPALLLAGSGALGQDILDLPVRYTDALEMTEEVH
jgi:hypothetical protein